MPDILPAPAERYLDNSQAAFSYVLERSMDAVQLMREMCFKPVTFTSLRAEIYGMSVLVTPGKAIEIVLRCDTPSASDPMYCNSMEQVLAFILARYW